jgi:hypothetical protein
MGVNAVDHELSGGDLNRRLAIEHTFAANYLEIGTFGLFANSYPGQDHATNGTDNYVDVALDLQHEYTHWANVFTMRKISIHEDQQLDASYALGGVQSP